VFPAAVLDAGMLPRPAMGAVLTAAALLGAVRIEGYGAYWPGQAGRLDSVAHGGGTVSIALGGAKGCYRAARGPAEVAACAGIEFGDMHGVGSGVRYPHGADSLWVAGSLGGRASMRIAYDLWLAVDAAVVVPFQRDEFILDDLGTVHRPSTVGARAALGPELRF
jgi:hypothetical protein